MSSIFSDDTWIPCQAFQETTEATKQRKAGAFCRFFDFFGPQVLFMPICQQHPHTVHSITLYNDTSKNIIKSHAFTCYNYVFIDFPGGFVQHRSLTLVVFQFARLKPNWWPCKSKSKWRWETSNFSVFLACLLWFLIKYPSINLYQLYEYDQRKFRNLTSDYTESCCWRFVNQEMWSRRCDTAEMWDMRIWQVGSARNAVFFHSFVASPARKVRS